MSRVGIILACVYCCVQLPAATGRTLAGRTLLRVACCCDVGVVSYHAAAIARIRRWSARDGHSCWRAGLRALLASIGRRGADHTAGDGAERPQANEFAHRAVLRAAQARVTWLALCRGSCAAPATLQPPPLFAHVQRSAALQRRRLATANNVVKLIVKLGDGTFESWSCLEIEKQNGSHLPCSC